MERLIVFTCLILTGCSGYSEEDLDFAREEGFDVGYEIAEEEAQSLIDEIYDEAFEEGYEVGYSDSQSNLYGFDNLDNISSSSQQSMSSLGKPSIDIDGYEWGFMLDFDKRELIQAIADYNGDYLSYSDVDSIIYLIDGYYENGMKYKTVGEVIDEL